MFTGIIESTGFLIEKKIDRENYIFKIQSSISSLLKIDQSVSHDGVCLTVTKTGKDWHEVVAIKETLDVTNLKSWEIGNPINLERAMILGARLDGHLVQGHVDKIGEIKSIEEAEGSWVLTISFPKECAQYFVHKGSICMNGVSLTVISPDENTFKVAIIPYTWDHTNFSKLKISDDVNLEFDIIGKYILRKEQLNSM
jgi:riboflavin synthase